MGKAGFDNYSVEAFMPNALFFGFRCLREGSIPGAVASAVLVGLNEGSLQTVQCAEDSARYKKTGTIGAGGI